MLKFKFKQLATLLHIHSPLFIVLFRIEPFSEKTRLTQPQRQLWSAVVDRTIRIHSSCPEMHWHDTQPYGLLLVDSRLEMDVAVAGVTVVVVFALVLTSTRIVA